MERFVPERRPMAREPAMRELLLVFNVGSTTLKVAVCALDAPAIPLFRLGVELASGCVWSSGRAPGTLQVFEPNQDLAELAAQITCHAAGPGERVAAVAHRIMHGGRHDGPEFVTDALLQELQDLELRCPLQQPPALEVVCHLRELWPALPQLAVFDTSFHRRQTALATAYALPASLRLQGVQAGGFHGISCQHVLRELRCADAALAAGRVLIAHLGQSASLTAVRDGESVASSMGFSTLEGLPMGTRCGQIDPGVLLYLMEQGWSKSRLTDLLYHKSGLLGLSGQSADMRELLASHRDEARFAVEYFCERAARMAASLACAMEGLDVLVFTGGIGEQHAIIREKICRRLRWMGVELDPQANVAGHGLRLLSTPASRCCILVVPCDEEMEISLQSAELLGQAQVARAS